MVLIATDIETYVKYDGTKECEEYIINNSRDYTIDKKTGLNLQQKYFKENKKKGYWYPVLDSTKYALGCVWMDGNKNPVFFTDAEEHFQYLLKIVKQKMKEGHNTYIYAHNHSYDVYGYAKNHIKDTEIIDFSVRGSLYGYIGYTKTSDEEKDDEEARYYIDKYGKKKKRKRHPRGYLLDTKAFLQGEASRSLADVGEILGFPKMKMLREVKDLNELVEYLKRDTEIVLRFVKELKRGLSELGHTPKKLLTAGNTAMSYFRQYCDRKLRCLNCGEIRDVRSEKEKYYAWCDRCHRKAVRLSSYLFEGGRIIKPKNYYNVKILKNAHRGGRNELYKEKGFIGKKIVNIDINSLYPYVMANMEEFPDLRSEFRLTPMMFTTEDTLKFIGVVEASVYFPEKKLGYLGYRYRNGLFFPYKFDFDIEEAEAQLRGMYEEGYDCEELLREAEKGTLKGGICRGFWTTFELRRALEEGYKILKIHDGVLYRDLGFNPFKELQTGLYDLRMKSEGVMKTVIKLIMNNMYGKFAEIQTEEKRAYCDRKDLPVYEKRGYEAVKDIDNQYFVKKESNPKLAGSSHPIITTLITALARDVIYRELKKIANDDFEDLVYTNTDSIFFMNKKKHIKKFKIGEKMGEFKIERDEDEGLFARENSYRHGKQEVGDIKEDKKILKEIKKMKLALSGSPNRNISDEQLLGKKPYYTDITYSQKKAFLTGNFEKAGTKIIVQKFINMNKPSKREVIFPFYNREGVSPKLKTTKRIII